MVEIKAAELMAAILNLGAATKTETERWREAVAVYLRRDLAPEQSAKVKVILDDLNTVREQRVGEIRAVANDCQADVRAILYRAAVMLVTSSGEGVPELLADAAALLPISTAGATDNDAADETRPADNANQPSLEARALALLVDHPDWYDWQIAEAAGCSRTSLYRLEKFKAAREQMKGDGMASKPRGSKADGRIEAWDDDQ